MTSIAALGCFVVLSSCCDHVVDAQERSPGGDKLAVVTVTNCGASSDYNTAITLRDAKFGFSLKDRLVLSVEGRHPVTVVWRDSRTLVVDLPSSARERDFADRKIVHRNSEVDGIHIEYHQH
jgi:hypothetical protein